MHKLKAPLVAAMIGALSLTLVGPASAEGEVPGSSPENPIVVSDPSEVPEGAVEDESSTYETPENACDTTRSWVLTIPATDDQTHEEIKLLREVPAVEEVSHLEWGTEERTREWVPGQSHQEFRFERTVTDYKTQYHFRKYVQTQSRTYTKPADFVAQWNRTVAFRPHRPHVPGHVLFVPRFHVDDAAEAPGVTAYTVADASRYVKAKGQPANIITSVGAEATQTVFHLHVHVIPRGEDDGLRASWPWRVKPGEELGPGEVAPADWEPKR